MLGHISTAARQWLLILHGGLFIRITIMSINLSHLEYRFSLRDLILLLLCALFSVMEGTCLYRPVCRSNRMSPQSHSQIGPTPELTDCPSQETHQNSQNHFGYLPISLISSRPPRLTVPNTQSHPSHPSQPSARTLWPCRPPIPTPPPPRPSWFPRM